METRRSNQPDNGKHRNRGSAEYNAPVPGFQYFTYQE